MLLSTRVWALSATSWPELMEGDTLNSSCGISPASSSWTQAAPAGHSAWNPLWPWPLTPEGTLPARVFSAGGGSAVAQACPIPCDPMDCSTPGLPVHHQLPELPQTLVHQVSDAIQPSHPQPPLLPPSVFPSIRVFFQRVSSSHQVDKVLELQLQHQSLQ